MNLQPSTVTNPADLSQYHFGKAGLSSIDSYKGFSATIGSIYSSIDFGWDKFFLLAVRFALFDASQNLSQQPCILFDLNQLY